MSTEQAIQRDLLRLGRAIGPVDGVLGPRSKAAIRAILAALPTPVPVPGMAADGIERPAAVSAAGIDLVRRFEGCRLVAYPDPASGGEPWTIGWGATGPGIAKGTVWTQAEADARLAADLAAVAVGVARLTAPGAAAGATAAATSQAQFDALVAFAYNVGLAALAGSTLLRLHRAGDTAGAAAQFARWNRAGGKALAGLTLRRAAEADLYRSASREVPR